MINGVNHIGIATSSIEGIKDLYKSILEGCETHEETVAEQKSKILSFQVGGTHIEFLEPTEPDSPIAKFIEKRGAGVHHIALATDNIEHDMQRLKDKGFRFIDETPRTGMNNTRIAFLHPKSTGSILLELCQE